MEKAVALVGAGPVLPGASSVPGFLAKLWVLVEDPGSDDVISWSRNGQNFCILDEQRFTKELLPKYFKHNNLSSFIRQLNIYGFRKVIALENGMITCDKNPATEFQHPFFKRGKVDLLANIKRKPHRLDIQNGRGRRATHTRPRAVGMPYSHPPTWLLLAEEPAEETEL